MIEKKYVIKNIKTNKFLSPYNYGNHWVDIYSAQRFPINTGKEEILDFVDFVWIEGEEVELIKVKVQIEIEEIKQNKENKIKTKDYILSKEDFLKLKEINKSYRKRIYNSHGTKLIKLKLIHHMIFNIIRDDNYLKGIEFGKRRFFETHSKIVSAKDKIFNTDFILKDLNCFYQDIFDENKVELIQEKLKKQIEN